MKFFAVLLLSLVAICYAKEEVQPQALTIEKIQEEAEKLLDRVKQAVEKVKNFDAEKVLAQLKEAAEKVKDVSEGYRQQLAEKLKEVSEKLKEVTGENASKLKEKVKEITEKVKDAYKNGASKLAEKLKEVANMVSKRTASAQLSRSNDGNLAAKLKEVNEKVQAVLEKVKENAREASNNVSDILNKVVGAVKDVVDKVTGSAGDLLENVGGILKEIGDKLRPVGRIRDFINSKKTEREQLAEEVKELALKAVQKCKADITITDEAVDALRTGEFLNQEVDDTSKTFVSCYLEELGFIENGKPQLNTIRKRLGAVVGQAKTITTMVKCGFVGGDNPLDKTFNTYTCFFKNGAVVLE